MQEIHHQDGLAFRGNACQRIKQTVTGGCPGSVQTVHDPFDCSGLSSNDPRQLKRRKPLIPGDDEKRTLQYQISNKLRFTLAGLVLSNDKSKATFLCSINSKLY